MNASGTPQILKPQFDTLDAFARWYFQNTGPIPFSPLHALTKLDDFTGVTLYQDGRFQVQMWICDPHTEIPDHSHPDVDSIQIYVAGEIFLRLNGQTIIEPGTLDYNRADGLSPKNGFSVRVRPSDNHGATIGPRGGIFITIQEWLNGVEPESVQMNWKGEPLNDKHAAMLKPPEPAPVQNFDLSQVK